MAKRISPKATAGIYAEVISQIYDSIDKRIREAVSNSFDAKASEITMSVFFQNDKKIIISDNGYGMDEHDLENKYISLGGGDNYNNQDSIGRIGIGALSVFSLGDTIRIRTRKKNSDIIITAELDFSVVKRADRHSTPLNEIELGNIVGRKTATSSDKPHFTEITILDLSRTALEIFSDEGKTNALVETLERILPVRYRDDDIIFDKLMSEIRNEVINERYVIDTYFHVPHLNYNNYKIYRKSIYKIDEAKIQEIIPIFPYGLEGGLSNCLELHGYLYINANRKLPKSWQGINARVKNVTIEQNTFFGHEVDEAAKVRIGGDLYINNLDENNAIQSNRSGFATENNDYVLVENYMREQIERAIDKVRRHSKVDSLVKKYAQKTESIVSVLNEVAKIENKRTNADDFKNIDDSQNKVDEFSQYPLGDSLKEELANIDADSDIVWSGTMENSFAVEYDQDDYYTIYLDKEFQEIKLNVAGNSINCFIGHCGLDKPLVIKNNEKLYINLDSNLITGKKYLNLDPGFIKVVLIMYLNYLRCNGNAEFLYNQSVADLAY